MGKCLTKSSVEKTPKRRLTAKGTLMCIKELTTLTPLTNVLVNNISKKLIYEALSKNYLFREIALEDFEAIYKYFTFVVAEEKSFIFEQGSDGSLFFIINSGRVQVRVNGKAIHVLSKPACFGELALLSDFKRKASIQALSKCSFWVMSRDNFFKSLKKVFSKRIDTVREIISNTTFFSKLPEGDRDAIAQCALFHSYTNDEIIIRNGDDGNLLFILVSGCVVFKKGSEEFLRVDNRGDMFGEGSILTQTKRLADCVASGPTQVISLDAESMKDVLGSNFRTVLLKNIARNSIMSDPHMVFLNKVNTICLAENLQWKFYKNGELVISKDYAKKTMFRVVCVGSIMAIGLPATRVFGYHVIGLGNSQEKKLLKEDYTAVGDTVIGEITIPEIQNILKIEIIKLFNSLKKIKFLKKITIFNQLSLESLEMCSDNMKIDLAKQDHKIFEAGELSLDLFIVKKGTVQIYKSNKILRLVGKYQIFGDRCLKENNRSASAKCITHVKYCKIPAATILRLPEIKDILAEIERRKYYQNSINLDSMYIKFENESRIGRNTYCIIDDSKKYCYDMICIPKSTLYSEMDCYKLETEKKIMLSLDHRQILKLVSSGFNDDIVFFITEHVKGISLRTCNEAYELKENYIRVIIIFLASILDHLHDRDIIYRDLNPDNIIVSKAGIPYLYNFYNSRVVPNRTYTRIGDPYYRSPEMILGRGYSKSTDYWSLGVILYELVYNHLPFNINNYDPPVLAYDNILKESIGLDDCHTPAVNSLISKLLSPAETRISHIQLRASPWMYSTQWDKLLSLTTLPIDAPKIKVSEKQSFKNKVQVGKFLSVILK